MDCRRSRNALPEAQIVIAPIADGGEGTAAAIVEAGDGEWIVCPAHDALGRARETRYGWLPERALAAIDMSAAAGLAQLAPNERDPLRASTFGVGEMLQHAAGRRASQSFLASAAAPPTMQEPAWHAPWDSTSSIARVAICLTTSLRSRN